jgi:hypothetical protein
VARKVFYSFNFKVDPQRVAKVKNMGVVEGQTILSSNKWEDVKAGGDSAIQAWIDEQMTGKSCIVVLIGASTAGRRWVKYEIKKAWADGRGLVGVYIHNLTDLNNKQTAKGTNPFSAFTVGDKDLDSIAKAYDSRYVTSGYVYNHINENLPEWVEEAIDIRKGFNG